jgi:hypothetical protein
MTWERCEPCKGSGERFYPGLGAGYVLCGWCNGRGGGVEPCDNCGGAGEVLDNCPGERDWCDACGGLGGRELAPRWPWLQLELGRTLLALLDAEKCERCGRHTLVTWSNGTVSCWFCRTQSDAAYVQSRMSRLLAAPWVVG